MIKYLLDTNIVIYTVKNKPSSVRKKFRENAGRMCVSSVTLMELVFGAENSQQPERNLGVIEGFFANLEVLSFDADAAIHTGQIRAELTRDGRPIGPYDQMIAGHTRSRGLILVSNNTSEFERVKGIRLENWA
ncbi:MAG: tRNA(fMet)-specific endonuclease VapC [Xanthomonadales bacterium]|nr:tRNA(fMet)-specific endonuclease VapC [Xanthomonadales bacterium]